MFFKISKKINKISTLFYEMYKISVVGLTLG